MKHFILLFLFLGICQLSFGQKRHNDVIYPIQSQDSITFCQIMKIRKGNQVIYQHYGVQDTVEAIAVVKNGEFIDFRTYEEIKLDLYPHLNPTSLKGKGVDAYKQYESLYQKYRKQEQAGLILTVMGGILLGTSFIMANSETPTKYEKIGTTTFVLGGLGVTFGTPIWISSYIKAENNKIAMNRCKKPEVTLNCGATEDGLALILKF